MTPHQAFDTLARIFSAARLQLHVDGPDTGASATIDNWCIRVRIDHVECVAFLYLKDVLVTRRNFTSRPTDARNRGMYTLDRSLADFKGLILAAQLTP